jgi:hypothetical protein
MKEAPMKGKLIRPAVVAVAIAAALLVAGGIAYATIPDGSGVIHGCYQKNQGTLRVIDTGTTQTCSSSEAPLTWSQTGPQGEQGIQGQQGIQGPKGDTGPTGPSDVYSVDGFEQPVKGIPGTPTVWETLATTPTLPAGSYFVQSEVELENFNSVQSEYFCDLVDSSANEYQATNATADPTTDWVTIPLQAVVTLAGADTISFRCTSKSSFGAEAFNWQLAAIKVGAVHS